MGLAVNAFVSPLVEVLQHAPAAAPDTQNVENKALFQEL